MTEPARAPTPAEEEKVKAETDKLRAEIRKTNAEADKAEAEARQAQITLAEAEDDEKARKAADMHHHVYAFTGAVDGTAVKACMRQLTQWHRNDASCEIAIVFNSPGGSIVDGMALFDYIQFLRSEGHRVTTIALGMAASMAGVLLQAGDVRVMGAEAWLLIHEAAFGAIGKTGEIEDTVEWVKRIQRRILRIFANRSKLSEQQIARRWHRKDWWIDSAEALKLGLIDEVQGQAKAA